MKTKKNSNSHFFNRIINIANRVFRSPKVSRRNINYLRNVSSTTIANSTNKTYNIDNISNIDNTNCVAFTTENIITIPKKIKIIKVKDSKTRVYEIRKNMLLNLNIINEVLKSKNNINKDKIEEIRKKLENINNLFNSFNSLYNQKINVISSCLMEKQICNYEKAKISENSKLRQTDLKILFASLSKKSQVIKKFQMKFGEVQYFVRSKCRTNERFKENFKNFEILSFVSEVEKLKFQRRALERDVKEKMIRNEKERENNNENYRNDESDENKKDMNKKGLEDKSKKEMMNIKNETNSILQKLRKSEMHKIKLVELLEKLNKGEKINEETINNILKYEDNGLDIELNNEDNQINAEKEIEKDTKLLETLDMKFSVINFSIKDNKIMDQQSLWNVSNIIDLKNIK